MSPPPTRPWFKKVCKALAVLLVLLFGAQLVVLGRLMPVWGWFNPLAYLDGAFKAKERIARGGAIMLENQCVVGDLRTDPATGLPVHVTGLLTREGVIWFEGYKDEIDRAMWDGRLARSSVRERLRIRDDALAMFRKEMSREIGLGDAPVRSPSGRYEVRVAHAEWDKNPIRKSLEGQVRDLKAPPEDNVVMHLFLFNDEPRLRVLFADEELSLFVLERQELTHYSIPHRCAIADYRDVRFPAETPAPSGR